MSLRHVPASSHSTFTSNTPSSLGAPSAPGIHDTLRFNLTPSPLPSTQPQSTHSLETRLSKWRATQDSLKMEGLRRTFGIAEPVRRGMELRLANGGEWRPMCLGGSAGVHGDVLMGRDGEVEWEDVFKGDELRDQPDFHTEMEARMRMNW